MPYTGRDLSYKNVPICRRNSGGKRFQAKQIHRIGVKNLGIHLLQKESSRKHLGVIYAVSKNGERMSPYKIHPTSNLNTELLHLLNEPRLGLGNCLLELRGFGTRTLSAGLLTACLTANDFADDGGPLLGGDALGGEML